MNLKSLIMISIFFVSVPSLAVEQIIYPNTEGLDRFQDLIEMLDEALKHTVDRYGPYALKATDFKMNERRSRDFFTDSSKKPGFNILFSAPLKEFEGTNVIPVEVAPRRGILGYRMVLTHKDKLNELKKVKTIKDLKKYVMLQGAGWGDVKIFKHNNIPVVEGAGYEGLFQMVNAKRADIFSRGITEIFAEFKKQKINNKNLAIEDSFIIRYDWPYLYMTRKENVTLKKRIEFGFEQIKKNGVWEKLFKKYYENDIKMANINKKTIIKLENPLLSEAGKSILKGIKISLE